jgi:hypothetical protein
VGDPRERERQSKLAGKRIKGAYERAGGQVLSASVILPWCERTSGRSRQGTNTRAHERADERRNVRTGRCGIGNIMLVWASRARIKLCGDGFFLGPPLGTAEDRARLHILYGPPETAKKVVALRKFFAICVGIEKG